MSRPDPSVWTLWRNRVKSHEVVSERLHCSVAGMQCFGLHDRRCGISAEVHGLGHVTSTMDASHFVPQVVLCQNLNCSLRIRWVL